MRKRTKGALAPMAALIRNEILFQERADEEEPMKIMPPAFVMTALLLMGCARPEDDSFGIQAARRGEDCNAIATGSAMDAYGHGVGPVGGRLEKRAAGLPGVVSQRGRGLAPPSRGRQSDRRMPVAHGVLRFDPAVHIHGMISNEPFLAGSHYHGLLVANRRGRNSA